MAKRDRPEAGKRPLKDPLFFPADGAATEGYGPKMAEAFQKALFDPAAQAALAREYADAWLRLWSSFFAPGASAPARRFDVFLSHAKHDEARVKQVRQAFADAGYSLYVDWEDDPLLDRAHVTRETAKTLQDRMRQCRALVLALSESSARSPWVQWEIGFFDAMRGMVFILPLDDDALEAVRQQEYHALYPVLDRADFVSDFVKRYGEALRPSP
jgi:hypothetical protein